MEVCTITRQFMVFRIIAAHRQWFREIPMPLALLGTDRFLLPFDREARDIVRGKVEHQLAFARLLLALLSTLDFVCVIKCRQGEENNGPDQRFFATHCCHFLRTKTIAPVPNTPSGNSTTGSQKIRGAWAAVSITGPLPPPLRGRMAMRSSSSANQLTVFRKRLPFPCTGNKLLFANSESPNTTNRAARGVALFSFSGCSEDSDDSEVLADVPALSALMVATAAMPIGPRRSLSWSNATWPSCRALRSVSAQLSVLVVASPWAVIPCGNSFATWTERTTGNMVITFPSSLVIAWRS